MLARKAKDPRKKQALFYNFLHWVYKTGEELILAIV